MGADKIMLHMLFGMGVGTKANFFRQLASLIESGMPMMGVIEALGRMRNSSVRRVVAGVAPVISRGGSLSEGLEQFPEYFDPYIIKLVRAGEVGGSLEVHLNALADYLERCYDQMMEFITRMVYPVVVFHGAIFIPPLFVLVMSGPLAYLSATLIPLFTIYGIIFLGWAVLRLLGHIPGFNEMVDSILIMIPFVGRYFKSRSAYRFMMVLGQLIEAGVGMETGIITAADACGNRSAAERFRGMLRDIRGGSSFTDGARRTGLIPETSLEMIHTGEVAGKLPFMLSKAGEMLDRNIREITKRILIVLPVLFYLLVAAYVGFIIISFFMQLYGPVMNI